MLYLDLVVSHTSLAFTETLNSDDLFILAEKSSIHRRIRNSKAENTKQDSQRAHCEVDVLPTFQSSSSRNIRKAVADGTAYDCEDSSRGEPPTLAESLLLLCVVAADDCHESGWDDTFHEAEKESLDIETLICGDCGGAHGDEAPEHHKDG